MIIKVHDIAQKMEQLAPLDLAFEWDNVGLQIGCPSKVVDTILITLTLTEDVLKRAIDAETDLIIAHHPLIFSPLRTIRKDQPLGSLVWKLIQEDMALYVSHTNLDQAPLGLNQWLAQSLQLKEPRVLVANGQTNSGLGRIGQISQRTFAQLARDVENLWGQKVKMVGNPDEEVQSIAILGGSGGKYINEAKAAGADVLITGDVSYHQALDGLAAGLKILDAGHFGTEKLMVANTANYLRKYVPGEFKILEEPSVNPFQF